MPPDVKIVYETLSLIQDLDIKCSGPAGQGIYHYIDVSWNSRYIEIQWSEKEGFYLSVSGSFIPGRGDYAIINEHHCFNYKTVIDFVVETIKS